MLKSVIILATLLVFSSSVFAKSVINYSMLKGSFVGEGAPMYIFHGTRTMGITEGNACQYGGQLTQSKNNNLEFVYINKGADGSIEGCRGPKSLKIRVLEQNSQTGLVTKIKVSSSGKKDSSFEGIYSTNN